LSYDSRLQLYDFLRMHLKGESEPVREEPPVAEEPDRNLWVSESGNLIKSFGGETPFTLTKTRYQSLPKNGSGVSLDRLLRLEQPLPSRPASLRKVPSPHGVSIEALDIPAVANVGLPVWLFRGERIAKETPAVLILDPRGRNSAWHEGELCQTLAGQGFMVCAADVRGIGDLAPQFSPGAPGYARFHQKDENYAWASLMLGRSLVGQRATDILALARALRQIGQRDVVVAALDELTVPAIFAASLDPSLDALYLAGGLSSFASIVQTEDYRHPFANFVPGLLEHTDLPEILLQLAPRRVAIAGPVGGNGEPLSLEAAKAVYQSSLAGGHLSVTGAPQWSAAALARFALSPR
jgi:hypothetical protein